MVYEISSKKKNHKKYNWKFIKNGGIFAIGVQWGQIEVAIPVMKHLVYGYPDVASSFLYVLKFPRFGSFNLIFSSS